MTTMRAAVVREHGDPEHVSIEEREIPDFAADQVLIKVHAIGMNHLDLWVRRGVPGHPFPLPMVLGCDFSGVVARVGSAVRNAKEGDQVCVAPGFSCGTCQACLAGDDNLCRGYGIYGETQDGGCAEYAVVSSANVIPMPATISFEEAAAYPLASLTAWNMLVRRCHVRPGQTVLVHAAGSGVGSAAVQIAKLWGAQVIATASTEEKLAHARALGADHTINYVEKDFAKEVRALTGKAGVDIVFEHTGAATWDGSVRSVKRGGRLVTCGATSGFDAKFDLRMLFFKNIAFMGSTMGCKGDLWTITDLIGSGRLKAVVDRVMPLDEVRAAHRALEARETFGKIVLVP